MKVKELFEVLGELHPEAEVFVRHGDDWLVVDGVYDTEGGMQVEIEVTQESEK